MKQTTKNCKLQNFEFFKGQQFTKLKYILKVISPQKLHCSYTKDAELWQLRMSHRSLCSRSKNLLEILLGMLACLILACPSTGVKCLTFQTMLDCVVIFLRLQMHFQTFSSHPLTHTFLQHVQHRDTILEEDWQIDFAPMSLCKGLRCLLVLVVTDGNISHWSRKGIKGSCCLHRIHYFSLLAPLVPSIS